MDFQTLFSPKSIALIGASREETSVGYSLLKNMLTGTFKGHVYPINPKATDVLGVKAYPTITDVPGSIDVAIIAVPSPIVQVVSEQAIAKGVKGIIVISAGFREQGEEGKKREEDLAKLCTNHGVILIGPNCLGFLNPHIGLNASFETVLPQKGNIAFLSQSGALISAFIDIALSRGIGFSKIVSLGNKTLVGEHELIPYLFQDPETSVILLYAEFLNDAPYLITLIRENLRSANPKPVLLLKAGTSSEGQKASSSHTGSLAGSDEAYTALCQQAGIVRVFSVDELLSTAQVLSQNPLPKGNSLAIVTNAGGPGIIATDAASSAGLSLSSFSGGTPDTLRSILPPASHVANPVDLLGDAKSDRYEKVLSAVSQDENVHSVITIVTPQSMTDIPETAATIVRMRKSVNKPLVATFMGAPHVEQAERILSLTNVTHIQFPEPAVTALGHAAYISKRVAEKRESEHMPEGTNEDVRNKIADLLGSGVSLVDTGISMELFSKYGLPTLKTRVVHSSDEALSVANEISEVLALKIISPDISHKSEVGGVSLNVPKEKAGEAYAVMMDSVRSRVPDAKLEGVLLSEMVTGEGVEMIVGVKREPGLGTLILVGFGGIYVEVLQDTSFRFAPVNRQDVDDMIESLKVKKLLRGVRGKPALDEDALKEVVLTVAKMALLHPEIAELDINPLFVKEKGSGARILDARIVLSK